MKAIRFGLSSILVLTVGFAACERRNEPFGDRTDREPVRPVTPPTLQESPRVAPDERTEATRPVEPTRPATATAGNESAVTSITLARCDREARCDNVGNGKKYDSPSDCVTKTRAEWRDDLNARECPAGVSSPQLASCVKQIKEESCGNPVEKLESVLACRTVDLCKRG